MRRFSKHVRVNGEFSKYVSNSKKHMLLVVMELCQTNLKNYLTQASIKNQANGYQLDCKRIFKYIFQIVTAIQYLHLYAPSIDGIGIIHRDLKCANILMKRSNTRGELTIKLADFGMIYLPLFGTG